MQNSRKANLQAGCYESLSLSHRFAAAFFAIAFLFDLDNAAARAFPPLLAPNLLIATVWGLRVSFAGGVPGGRIGRPSPVAASTTALAICVKSRRVLAREGMWRL